MDGKLELKRREDLPLLRGKGNVVDDLKFPGQVYAAFVRSSVAHGRIIEIDSSRALELPGIKVFTGVDLNQHIRPIPVLFQHEGLRITSIPCLAEKKVRF